MTVPAMERAEEIGRWNALIAIDQVGEYSSRAEAFDSYRDNAIDTAAEAGLGVDGCNAAEDAFYAVMQAEGWLDADGRVE